LARRPLRGGAIGDGLSLAVNWGKRLEIGGHVEVRLALGIKRRRAAP
jgi:hypothetical protein